MHKGFMKAAAVLGALAVMLGAFGTHVVKSHLDAHHLAIYETANRYHFYHVMALLATGIIYPIFTTKWLRFAGYSFIIGVTIFCISLYLLAILGDDYKFLGAITPLGGILMILGWISLLLAISSKKDS